MASMLPTLSTRPNPQVWYTSTAGEPTSVQLGRVRGRGLTGADTSLAFFEWSADPAAYDPADPAAWARANPGMGIRISAEYIALERASLTADAFERERLGIGLYPVDLADAWLVVGRDEWAALADPQSSARDPVAFAAEMTLVAPRKQPWVTIAAAGQRPDGRLHVEIIDRRKETDWVAGRLVQLRRKHRPCATVVDPGGHAGSMIEGLMQAGVDVVESFTARDAAQAFGYFRDLVTTGALRHQGDERLGKSLAGATTRPLADALAWDRRDPRVDLGPVVAASLACWGFRRYGLGRVPPYDVLRSVG